MTVAIRVLLVDDDPKWRDLIATVLELEKSNFSIETCSNGRDALEALEMADIAPAETVNADSAPSLVSSSTSPSPAGAGVRSAPFDCVVSDYRMPDIDGLELLECVRVQYPNLPFILVTGEGDECVATEAIRGGVTDYVPRDGTPDHGTVLRNRIENAVRRWHIARELEESRQEFTALFREVPDPIVITDGDGRIVESNPAFTGTFGVPETARGEYLETQLRAVRSDRDDTVASMQRTADAPLLRVDTVEGAGSFLHRRFPLTRTVDRECHIYHDVTERVERQREIRRERDVKEAVRDVLVSTSSRREIQHTSCERLATLHDYSLVWIGEPTEDGVAVRTAVGDDSYLEEIDLGRGEEPSVTALESRTTQVHRIRPADGDEDDSVHTEPWLEEARARGYRGVIAVPLVYGDVPYGALTVYSTQEAVFTDNHLAVLEDIAETIAYALNAVDRRDALLSAEVVEVRMAIEDRQYPLVAVTQTDAFSSVDGRLSVQDIVPHSDGSMMKFVTVESTAGRDLDPEAITVAFEETDGVLEASLLAADATDARYRVVLETPSVGSVLASHGVVVDALESTHEQAIVTATFPARADVRSVIDAVCECFPRTSVRSHRRRERSSHTDSVRDSLEAAGLTDRQRQVLQTAYRGGFFEQPKHKNADQLAAELDITRSTFLQHLRAAQMKLYESLLD